MAGIPEDQIENVSVPVIEEELEVGKRRVEGDRVSVRTIPRERTEVVEQPLESMEVEIERVAIDRQIDTAPEIRNDGETLIIPVVEERLVVEKRLFLREEIHVHRRRTVTQFRQNVTLRSQEVIVERRDAAGDLERTETPQEG
jgi:uncharacterized protein (TIGR02271 family)